MNTGLRPTHKPHLPSLLVAVYAVGLVGAAVQINWQTKAAKPIKAQDCKSRHGQVDAFATLCRQDLSGAIIGRLAN